MKKSIEEKQYDKDVAYVEKIKTTINSFATIYPEQEKRRFKLINKDGKVKYISFSQMTKLNNAEKRIKIYELSKSKS